MDRTYLAEVYDFFLSSISDYTLLTISEEDIEEELFTYFKRARNKFHKCKQSLELNEDENGMYFAEFDEDGNEVKPVKLTGFEIEILAHLMLVEYMKPQLISTETIKQSLSDKDFKIYSQANQLREINFLYRLLQRECRAMITEYTYMGMIDDAKK